VGGGVGWEGGGARIMGWGIGGRVWGGVEGGVGGIGVEEG